MRTLDYNRIIVGYHGCDRSVVESVFLQGARETYPCLKTKEGAIVCFAIVTAP